MFSDSQCIKETVKKKKNGSRASKICSHVAGPDERVGVGGQGWLRQASKTANANDAKGQGPQ